MNKRIWPRGVSGYFEPAILEMLMFDNYTWQEKAAGALAILILLRCTSWHGDSTVNWNKRWQQRCGTGVCSCWNVRRPPTESLWAICSIPVELLFSAAVPPGGEVGRIGTGWETVISHLGDGHHNWQQRASRLPLVGVYRRDGLMAGLHQALLQHQAPSTKSPMPLNKIFLPPASRGAGATDMALHKTSFLCQVEAMESCEPCCIPCGDPSYHPWCGECHCPTCMQS